MSPSPSEPDDAAEGRDLSLEERAEAHFRALTEHSADIVTILDADGQITYESPSLVRMLGFQPAELVGTQALDWVHPEDRPHVRAELSRTMTEPGFIGRAEYRFLHKDGSWRMVESVGRSQLGNPDVAGIVVNTRDVTEHRRLAEQLRQAQKMEAVGRLAGGIAHDFNNLLTVIQGNCRLLLDGLAEDEALHRDAEEIALAAGRAAALTQQLLSFSKGDRNPVGSLDLAELVLGTRSMLARLIGEHITFRVETGEEPQLVQADRSHLEQVLLNLVINARDAMPTGGTLTLKTRTLGDESAGPEWVELEVADTGHGIPDSVRARIFEPFFSTKPSGTGLGLSTVVGIITENRGIMDVTSTSDGTIFTVRLPAAAATRRRTPSRGLPAVSVGGSETILMVEDEPRLRSLNERILSRRGYQVLSAGSGREALELVEGITDSIDLLLTDVVMPGMSGHVLAERLLARRSDLRVLYVSGYTGDVILDHGVGGHVDLLEKPFTPDQLLHRVRVALDRD